MKKNNTMNIESFQRKDKGTRQAESREQITEIDW
jgi:hypothetical protein